MIVVVTGSREWTNYAMIEAEIAKLPPKSTVVHGECHGADLLAARAARKHGHTVIGRPASWKLYGNAAGPIRNRAMLKDYMPDLVLAFILDHSKGATGCVKLAKQLGLKVEEFHAATTVK